MMLAIQFYPMSYAGRHKVKRRIASLLLLLCCMLSILGVVNAAEQNLKSEQLKKPVKVADLAYGQILFEYYRDRPIEALNLILVARQRGTLRHHSQAVELLSGVIYLDLGMMIKAESIFNRLLSEQDLKSELLAQLAFYLGKIHFKQQDYQAAESRLLNSYQHLKPELHDEALVMLANIAVSRNDRETAKQYLAQVPADSKMANFSRYNLAVLWLQEGLFDKAKPLFTQITQQWLEDDIGKSLQDKSWLIQGYYWISQKEPLQAVQAFEKVRLRSPSANKALLGTGWSYLQQKQTEKALASWQPLTQRDIRDAAVQEALLAVPYAYQKLDALQPALDGYLEASQKYQQQISLIDKIVKQVNDDQLVESLVDKIVTSRLQTALSAKVSDTQLFDNEFDYYLYELISSNTFNEGFRRYQKLGFLSGLLNHWQQQLPMFSEMIKVNEQHFAEQLPKVDAYLAQGATDNIRQQLKSIKDELKALKNHQNLYLLADKKQLALYKRIDRVRQRLARIPAQLQKPEHTEKLRRASGVLQWQLEQNKAQKMYSLQKQINIISQTLQEIGQQQNRLRNAKDIALNRFVGYQQKIDDGAQRIFSLKEKIQAQIIVQAGQLKKEILAELEKRKQLLNEYLLQSDLSIARLQEQAFELEDVQQ